MTAAAPTESGVSPDVLGIYARAARRYDLVNAIASFGTGRWYRDRTIRTLELPADAAVLDVGCGTGALALAAQRFCPESTTIVAVDPSEEMRSLARNAGVRDVRAGGFESLPVEAQAFDLVVSGYAIRYAQDLGLALDELHRVLRPGGRLVLLEMVAPSGPARRSLVGGFIRHAGAPILGALCASAAIRDLMRHFWDSVDGFSAPEDVVRHLEAAGFEEAEYRPVGGLLGEFRAIRS